MTIDFFNGLFHIRVWLEKDMPENLIALLDMNGTVKAVVDISGKREDCEDPDQTSGGDDCGDTRGG